jgi:hypothetical protein
VAEGRRDDNRSLEERYNTLRFDTILAELELGITFCCLAHTARNGVRRERSKAHAEKAYEVATRYMRGTKLTADMRRQIEDKSAQLASLLASVRQGTKDDAGSAPATLQA